MFEGNTSADCDTSVRTSMVDDTERDACISDREDKSDIEVSERLRVDKDPRSENGLED